ncbi:two-component regulator propeller domain-containing protein [Rheinheimera sp. SA_1]|uniref:two-component regulator propeller domain-containing protein n=1 Tax=Rheinheimera sp. SA_1 TaxID=1827365 RepID=UPI0018D38BB6|nr:two-component regulator propeller domain-containing protein [Rheinheimera sp. SA_1]
MLWEPGWLLRCWLLMSLLAPMLVNAVSPHNLPSQESSAALSLHNVATTTTTPASVEVYSRFMQLGRQHPFLSQATALVQDAQGFLWIGTQHGLYRYDGQVVEIFRADPTDANSLSSDWISSLMLDRRGQLWVGTRYGGLNLFDPATERFSRIAIPRSQGIVQQVEISALYQDKNLQIWVGTFGAGLYRWQAENQQLELVQLPAAAREIDGLFINSLLLDDEGYLWIGTGSAPLRNRGQNKGGALRWHPQRLDKQLFSVDNSALKVAAVTTIKMDATGQIWLTSYGGGLLKYQQSSQKLQVVAQQPELLKNGLLTDLWFGKDGGLWISSYDHGLWYLPAPDQPWQQFRANPIVAHQIQSNNLTGLWLDNQQTLWVKSPAGIYGLSAIAQKVRNLPVDPNNPALLAHNDVFGMSHKSGQTYWLANRDAGVAEADLTTATVKRWPIRLAQPQEKMPTLVRQVLQDHLGVVWIGTDSGLFQLDQSTGLWQRYLLTDADVQPHIGVLYQDALNRFWVGTRGEGLFLLDGSTKKQFRQDLASDIGLASDTISTMRADEHNDLWIGYADQGLSRLELPSGKVQSWREGTQSAAGLRFNGIQLIYPEGGELWIRAGNVNHRVLRSKDEPKKIEGFKAYVGSDDADIYLRKAPNFLWLYRTQLQNQDLVQFNEAHGFQVTTWIGSWLVRQDGQHLRGGNQGLDYFYPAKFLLHQEPLVVRLTGFNVFNKKVRPAQDQKSVLQRAIGYASEVRLNYEQDMFTLQFSALDFVQPGQTRYRYRLSGFDRDWIETDASSRQATYTRLAPGDYQFEVMARRPGQSWPADGATRVLVKILPPWWLTWWAKIAAALLTFGAIWAFLHFRLRNERQTRNWLEQVVSSRTAELQTQNQALAESYRDMTLLQMLAKQITASLDLQEILFLCHKSLNEIMDVHVLAIGIFRPETQSLEFSHWLENGRLMEPFELKLQPEVNLASVSFNQQREINIQQREQFLQYLPEIPPPINGAPMQSVLYFPLVVDGEHIGCLSLQSPRVEAFAPQQTNLVRTLASNIAIAVANAQIVARLQQTQQQLVMQEKMASLGGLVAGVAHEVNTPLGICVTAASHLQLELSAITLAHQQRKLLVPEFERFLETANTAALMLTQNTERAAALINSFKQVAVDKSAISLREFDVAEYLKEVIRSLQPELNRRQCQLQLLSDPGITLYADAGSLAQLLTHLVMNSLQHGFTAEMRVPPLIELKVQKTPAHIQLEYRDNGCGMSADTLKRLFDPFFTTKRSEGNSGLGAHIVYNLVTAQLNGSIYASSEPGQGLYYRILLPQLRRPD